jgi:hypothetical protein
MKLEPDYIFFMSTTSTIHMSMDPFRTSIYIYAFGDACMTSLVREMIG